MATRQRYFTLECENGFLFSYGRDEVSVVKTDNGKAHLQSLGELNELTKRAEKLGFKGFIAREITITTEVKVLFDGKA